MTIVLTYKVENDHHKLKQFGNISELVNFLKKNTDITSLNLSGNKLGKKGAKALVPALQEMKNLTSLFLNWNALKKGSAEALVPALQEMKNLILLSLSENDLKQEDAQKLANKLPGCKVYAHEKFYIAQNHANNEMTIRLRYKVKNDCDELRIFNNTSKLVDFLKENTAIISLDLSWNNLGEVYTEESILALQEMTELTSLNFSWNNLKQEDAQKLANKLPGCEVYVDGESYTAQNHPTHAFNVDDADITQHISKGQPSIR